MARPLSKSQPKEIIRRSQATEPVGPVTSPISDVVPQRQVRQGFLPIKTNTFDRVFISVVCFVAIHLLWMRFFEDYLSLWVATILSLILAVAIIRRG
jgi:predicted small integral membrane protein